MQTIISVKYVINASIAKRFVDLFVIWRVKALYNKKIIQGVVERI